MKPRSSALTTKDVKTTIRVLTTIINNRKLQLTLDPPKHIGPELRNLDEQMVLATSLRLVADEGKRITEEEP